MFDLGVERMHEGVENIRYERPSGPEVTDWNIGLPIAATTAQDWIRGSLAQGSVLAMLMTQCLPKLASARMLVPRDALEPTALGLDNHARGIRASDTDGIAARFLDQLFSEGVATLIVENELARRGDPSLPVKVSYADDRVLEWADLESGGDSGARLLRSASSGYPLNAFACRRSAPDLGLIAGHQLDSSELDAIVASTLAVLVAVYDGESYVALMSNTDEPQLQ